MGKAISAVAVFAAALLVPLASRAASLTTIYTGVGRMPPCSTSAAFFMEPLITAA